MRYRITTPEPGFTGVSAGVNFTDGVAVIDAPPPLAPLDEGKELGRQERAERDLVAQHEGYRRLAYFRSAGYVVEELDDEEAAPAGEPAPSEPQLPARSASKAEWVAAAVARGIPAEDAEKATKEQLIELLTSEEQTA